MSDSARTWSNQETDPIRLLVQTTPASRHKQMLALSLSPPNAELNTTDAKPKAVHGASGSLGSPLSNAASNNSTTKHNMRAVSPTISNASLSKEPVSRGNVVPTLQSALSNIQSVVINEIQDMRSSFVIDDLASLPPSQLVLTPRAGRSARKAVSRMTPNNHTSQTYKIPLNVNSSGKKRYQITPVATRTLRNKVESSEDEFDDEIDTTISRARSANVSLRKKKSGKEERASTLSTFSIEQRFNPSKTAMNASPKFTKQFKPSQMVMDTSPKLNLTQGPPSANPPRSYKPFSSSYLLDQADDDLLDPDFPHSHLQEVPSVHGAITDSDEDVILDTPQNTSLHPAQPTALKSTPNLGHDTTQRVQSPDVSVDVLLSRINDTINSIKKREKSDRSHRESPRLSTFSMDSTANPAPVNRTLTSKDFLAAYPAANKSKVASSPQRNTTVREESELVNETIPGNNNATILSALNNPTRLVTYPVLSPPRMFAGSKGDGPPNQFSRIKLNTPQATHIDPQGITTQSTLIRPKPKLQHLVSDRPLTFQSPSSPIRNAGSRRESSSRSYDISNAKFTPQQWTNLRRFIGQVNDETSDIMTPTVFYKAINHHGRLKNISPGVDGGVAYVAEDLLGIDYQPSNINQVIDHLYERVVFLQKYSSFQKRKRDSASVSGSERGRYKRKKV
ncbi:hypothetical protein BABINDRAFT_163944 [Babjeviella inositovora NRRL Y-12698]|uniref:Uncharacterized protein n=1 Tax=Babjeviella inositovora NRRL Y-12698 TaxID=984486 RepID=A0A1E3QIQ1_9ASCO|nr:uncharacterized protein BABINDRAFT_163944 [Babjeviella inositovora NRRL Y-12698]ODQ76942.1 hypothetical protein BABINDRAFT_163944 [Babjeviella inositovora NRRL Y-12698]